MAKCVKYIIRFISIYIMSIEERWLFGGAKASCNTGIKDWPNFSSNGWLPSNMSRKLGWICKIRFLEDRWVDI